MIKVSYSILASNFLELQNDIRKMEQAKVDYLHLDIMDGHFVENITFGSQMVKNISEFTSIPLDCHLMVDNPEKIINQLVSLPVEMISFHIETITDVEKNIDIIKKNGKKAGIVLNPKTSLDKVEKYLNKIDFILQMTVEPGKGGQTFIESTLKKIEWLNNYREVHHLNYKIEVDGGVNGHTSKDCIIAGADILVSGSYLNKSIYPGGYVKELKKT